MPKTSPNRKKFPVKVYDSINHAMHKPFGTKLSSRDTQMVASLVAQYRFWNHKTKTEKYRQKKMYINMRDLLPYRELLNEMFYDSMNKFHQKKHGRVVMETKNSLGELDRQVELSLRVINKKKKGIHDEVLEKYFTKNPDWTPEKAAKALDDLKKLMDEDKKEPL